MKFLNNSFITVLIIFALAFLLRLFLVTSVPPSINWDEASLGYNAYSILKTGKDEWGRFMPLSFEAFGDYKLPGYIYTLVPFISVFGLNEFSVRFPSIFFGSLSIIFLYLLVSELTQNRKWAILSAFLLAISPWHFFLSRIALEANLALSFFLIGFSFLMKGLKKNIYFIPSALMLGVSIFTYNSARIFIPLFLFVFLILFRKKIKLNFYSIISSIIFLIFLGVGFYFALFQDSSARYFWVRILDEGAISFLEETRNNSSLSPMLTNLIYNRYTYFVFNFFSNYLKHFSVQFLALSGGSNYQFSLQGMGLIYLAEFPFLIFGFSKLLKDKIGWMFLFWILLAPIPSALTREAPHALRSIFMIGSIQVITAFGIIAFFKIIEKRKFITNISYALVVFLIAGNAMYYLSNYFNLYPVKYSQSWQYGNKQAVDFVLNNYSNYPKIYFTKRYGEPHVFYLFFSKYDPEKFQSNPELVRYGRSNWRWVDRLDKIYFINDWEVKEILKNEKNALIISSPENYPENAKKLEAIYFLDGSKAFEIVKI